VATAEAQGPCDYICGIYFCTGCAAFCAFIGGPIGSFVCGVVYCIPAGIYVCGNVCQP
jgi:hypothetical protein